MRLQSNILKIALFATGLSGVVAEYILSTLASYFIGDSVIQWTLIVSIMLFAMGLGSRITKNFKSNLLQIFILTEFILSVLVAWSGMFSYLASSFTIYTGGIIYFLAILIGVLIGMEIPMVIRLNDTFEELRINVSSVMEKDYYGALVGGLFFAFVGLPYLGLTYTPFVLGLVNFTVALMLFSLLKKSLSSKLRRNLILLSLMVSLMIISGFYIAKPIILWGEQKRYKDTVIFSSESKYQRITITKWKEDYWLYINGNQQLCTYDEMMYHEPLVHPAMLMHQHPQRVLVLGGGDGCAAREILKHKSVEKISLVDLDPMMTNLARTHPVLVELNDSSFFDKKLEIHNSDGFIFIDNCIDFYDVIIIDLPDPRSVELGRLYSFEFYSMCKKRLRPNGILVTQAGSPYFAAEAFNCINKTIEAAGFQTLPFHNQIISLGEWGWILGMKNENERFNLLTKFQNLSLSEIQTEWLNEDALIMMSYFGQDIFSDTDSVDVNKIHNPVLYRYYLSGSWDLY